MLSHGRPTTLSPVGQPTADGGSIVYTMSTKPQSIGEVLDSGFRLFRVSARGILPFGLVTGIASVALFSMFDPERMEAALSGAGAGGYLLQVALAYVVYMLLVSALLAAIVHYCDAVARGGDPSMTAALARGVVKVPVLAVALVLYFLAVILGSIALIVPGMILTVSLFFYTNRIVLEDDGPLACLVASHRLVWGNWWRTAVILTVVMVIYFVLFLALGIPLALVDEFVLGGDGMGYGPFGMLGEVIVYTVGMPYITASILATYYDLRLRKEGGDLESRLAEIG